MSDSAERGHLAAGGGIERRDFLRTACILAAAAVGLPEDAAAAFMRAAQRGLKPSVIWLSFQECTGCTEGLLRTSHPDLGELVLDLVSLDYHEALLAAAGHQAEEARRAAMERHAGEFVLVAEGAVPMKDDGIYCKIGGVTAVEMLRETAEDAGAIIAIGSCASWGGIPSSGPNPTGATGIHEVLEGKQVVNIPGCPPNPYNFLGTVLQFATYGTLPALDEKGRPKWAYGRTIHEHCPRRPHFDAGRFARRFGDEGHREGWCLYELGCKGPVTPVNCSTQHYNETPGVWPVGIGHPCFGCSEEGVGFTIPLHETVEVPEPTPFAAAPPVGARPDRGGISPWATGVGGAILGGLAGAGFMASKKLGEEAEAAAGTGGEAASTGGDTPGGPPTGESPDRSSDEGKEG